MEAYLLQELSDSVSALRVGLATYSALSDTAMAIRSDLSNFGNVFSDGSNATNRLTYWNSTDSVNAYDDVFIDPINNRIGVGTNAPQYRFHVNGDVSVNWLQINGAYVLPTSDGAPNQVLMTDGMGNVSWVDIDTAICPVHMTNIGGRICMETNERNSTDWFTAVSTCAAEGYKLPTWGEWYAAMDNAVLNNETNNWEWVDGGTSNAVRKVGNGNLRATANDDPSNSSAYRCVLILK